MMSPRSSTLSSPDRQRDGWRQHISNDVYINCALEGMLRAQCDAHLVGGAGGQPPPVLTAQLLEAQGAALVEGAPHCLQLLAQNEALHAEHTLEGIR